MDIRDELLSFIKQNGYYIDMELLSSLYNNETEFNIFMQLFRPNFYENAVYGTLYINVDRFITRFKDNESIYSILNYCKFTTRNNYNLDYDNEEDLLINNYSFTVTYNYKVNNINEIAIIDKNSKKLLIVINQKEVSINSDIFKLFDNEVYKRYQKNQKWLTNSQELFTKIT